MEPLKPICSFELGPFTFELAPEIVMQWVILVIITLLVLWLTKNLKIRPTKKQVAVEYLYTALRNVVIANVGEKYIDIIPFVGSFGIFILFMNLMGLFGVPIPTKSFSVTVALALISFFIVQFYSIRKFGFKSYFKGYTFPMVLITPINILERIMLLFH